MGAAKLPGPAPCVSQCPGLSSGLGFTPPPGDRRHSGYPTSGFSRNGRGGWTLNSAGYLLGPVLQLPQMSDQDRKRETALEILDLWKAIDGLPYSHPPQPSKRNVMETFAKPEIEDLDVFSKKIPKEEDVLKS
ncbi:galanin-like peptide [Trachypithecus francoisi]|uniref:galanin-like peptide n=1 Tax=Trachypithecus francoisi TaxID=54180 RepID=UPI00141BBF56|nr:galanin-like peptide [Trachypithecus francoisi]